MKKREGSRDSELRKEGSKERGELKREPSVLFHSPTGSGAVSPTTSPRDGRVSPVSSTSPTTGTLRARLPSRSVNDVDLMVWGFSSSAPIQAEQSEKQSTPMGLIGLVEDETVQMLFGGTDSQARIDNASLRQNSVIETRPPEGPIAPSFSQVQYEKLLNRESEYTNRIAELEAQVAKLTREKDELVKEVFSLRSGKASCMVCKVGVAEVLFEGCQHLCLCQLCEIHVAVCPLCQRKKGQKEKKISTQQLGQ